MKITRFIIKILICGAVISIAFFIGTQCARSTTDPKYEEAVIITSSPEPTIVPAPSTAPLPSPTKQLYKVTAYCPCAKCCGKSDGITASGVPATEGVTVASGKELPFGTQIIIEGIGIRTVQDRGGTIQNNCLDLFFESHREALAFGVQWLPVEVITK